MRIRQHLFVILFIIFVVLAAVIPVPFFLILLLYFPGVYLASFLKKELTLVEGLFLPLLFGLCFWIVFSYIVSEISVLHWATVVIISFFSAVLADNRHISITKGYTALFLVVCCAFVVSYSYPWSQFYHWMPPGDDMKYHIPIIHNIQEDHSLPEDYGDLYPEIPTLTYPLGYHAIVALSATASIPSIMGVTLVIVSFACFPFYFLGKSMFNKKVGLYTAFSFSFLSLFFHRLSNTATYPNLLGITLQIFAFFLLYKTIKTKSVPLLVLTGLAFAAAAETHPYILLVNVMALCGLFIYFLVHKSFFTTKWIVYTGIVFFVLTTPYVLRLKFQSPTPLEIQTFAAWYADDSLLSLEDLTRNLSILSPLVILFGIIGAFTIKGKKMRIIALWVALLLIFPVLSVFQVRYPGWYTLSPNRFLFYVFMPLCICCGKLFADLENRIPKTTLYFIGVLILLSVGMHHFNAFNSFLPDPVYEVQMNPDDAFVIQWIKEHTTPDTIIVNTGAAVDCSSWVPALAERRVVFPFFSGYRGDGCIQALKPHKGLADFKIVKHVPDSAFALHVLTSYNADYIYIPAWKKRVFLDFHPDTLAQSPLYQLVVNQGDAYLFKVVHATPGTTFFCVKKGCTTNIHFVPTVSSDVYGTFFLHILYTDDQFGQMHIVESTDYRETVYKYDTGDTQFLVVPLSGKDIDVIFHGDSFIEEWRILFGLQNAVKISEHLGLKGDWLSSESDIIAPADNTGLRLYFFDVKKGEIVLTYKDTGYGNVDINVSDASGKWHTIKTVYRQNTGDINQVLIPVDEYTIVVFGVYVYGDPFTVLDIQYTPD